MATINIEKYDSLIKEKKKKKKNNFRYKITL